MCTCYFYTTNLQHFCQHRTTLVVTIHVSWGSKYHKNNFAAGALPQTPLGKLTSWHFVEGGKGKEGKNNGKGGTTEKGLQCPEFLTWKVGNPSEALRAKIERKSTISYQRGHFDPKFQVQGVAPPMIFARLVRPMNALQLCR